MAAKKLPVKASTKESELLELAREGFNYLKESEDLCADGKALRNKLAKLLGEQVKINGTITLDIEIDEEIEADVDSEDLGYWEITLYDNKGNLILNREKFRNLNNYNFEENSW